MRKLETSRNQTKIHTPAQDNVSEKLQMQSGGQQRYILLLILSLLVIRRTQWIMTFFLKHLNCAACCQREEQHALRWPDKTQGPFQCRRRKGLRLRYLGKAIADVTKPRMSLMILPYYSHPLKTTLVFSAPSPRWFSELSSSLLPSAAHIIFSRLRRKP